MMTACCRCPAPAVYVGHLYTLDSLRTVLPERLGECGFCAGCYELLMQWCGTKAVESQGMQG